MELHELTESIVSETRSIRDVVYERLKDAIISERFKPGHHLKERELAALLGISTTPLKEALRRLEQEGLVTTSARRGTFVSSDIMNSFEEINLARSALEGVAARLAAEKITDEELRQLTEAIEKIRLSTKQMDAAQIAVWNDRFHSLIRMYGKNNYIYQQIKAIRSFDSSFRKKALSHPDEFERAEKEHRAIYEAIAKRDGRQAEQVMIMHIRRTISFVREKRE